MNSLSQNINKWVEKKEGWFSYAVIDFALAIDTPKKKTLRRVVIKNLCDQGKIHKHPNLNGVYLSTLKPVEF